MIMGNGENLSYHPLGELTRRVVPIAFLVSLHLSGEITVFVVVSPAER